MLVILDRDGVINFDSDNYIRSKDEWIPIPGSIEAIVALQKAGYKVAIATNQSGLARGYYSFEDLEAMHYKMQKLLIKAGGASIKEIHYCPHLEEDQCFCRKPKPQLLVSILAKTKIPKESSVFVGDSITDVRAAKSIGIRPILVRTGKGERTLAQYSEELLGCDVFDDLATFVDSLTLI